MKLPNTLTKPFSFLRGYALAFLANFGVTRYEETLKADMQKMVETGSPYTALTMARISGVPCTAAVVVLDTYRQKNRERWAELQRRRAEAEAAAQLVN